MILDFTTPAIGEARSHVGPIKDFIINSRNPATEENLPYGVIVRLAKYFFAKTAQKIKTYG